MLKPPFDKFLMFDVESVGLHGRAFAVGFVVYKDGQLETCGYWACEPTRHFGYTDDYKWVLDNVDAPPNVNSILAEREVKAKFWVALQQFKTDGYAIVTDCAWPVEGRFLNELIDENQLDRRWQGPYPLYDLSSVLAALGYDPIGTYPRLENELPAHNPLNDARQSARVLLEALAGTLVRPQ